MQSGRGRSNKWVMKFDTMNSFTEPLMGWESSKDTMGQVILEFNTKEDAINYAKKNSIDFYVVDPKKSKVIKKSYADNFLRKIK